MPAGTGGATCPPHGAPLTAPAWRARRLALLLRRRQAPTGGWVGTGMTALRSLVLANNLLETLPASLGKLIRLTNLDLSNNQARFCPLRPRRGAHDTRA